MNSTGRNWIVAFVDIDALSGSRVESEARFAELLVSIAVITERCILN